jgi:hypothetical protein
MLTDYMMKSDIEQPQETREPPTNMQTYDRQGQTNLLEPTGDATDRLHVVITEGQNIASRASGEGLDNLIDMKAGVKTQSLTAGKEESKDEIQLPSTGEKRRRPRRTQLADLLAGSTWHTFPLSGGLYPKPR